MFEADPRERSKLLLLEVISELLLASTEGHPQASLGCYSPSWVFHHGGEPRAVSDTPRAPHDIARLSSLG